MKIYLAGGAPKPYHKIVKRLLFTFFGIKFPFHRYGTKADFNFFKIKADENLSSK